jgi:hypothetical protein
MTSLKIAFLNLVFLWKMQQEDFLTKSPKGFGFFSSVRVSGAFW